MMIASSANTLEQQPPKISDTITAVFTHAGSAASASPENNPRRRSRWRRASMLVGSDAFDAAGGVESTAAVGLAVRRVAVVRGPIVSSACLQEVSELRTGWSCPE